MSIWSEPDVCGVCLRCTVDIRNKSSELIYSSGFQFQGEEWCLGYCYIDMPQGRQLHSVAVKRISGMHTIPIPLNVSVQLESVEKERTVTVLSKVARFTHESQTVSYWIWREKEDEILRAVPEFRLYGVLKLIVFLKVEGNLLPADFDSRPPPIKCSVPRATGQSSSTRSTSVQTTLLTNAIPCLESLSQDLAQLMVEDSHHDVEFQCADQSTKVHKLIVCKRSPVIASMLSSDMVEGRTGVVHIPNMDPDIFTQFMRYIYSGQLPELTFDTALRLYEAGDQYAVHSLAKRCSEFLAEHLSVDNACEVLVVADAHSNKNFVEKVVDYMVENRVPLMSEGWSAFCNEHPNLAIKVLNRTLKAVVK